MRGRLPIALIGLFLTYFLFSFPVYALEGDADGNGTVDLDDARTIARYVANQIPQIPDPEAADATQDGMINMEDAFVIARKVTGQTRIVVVAPRYGHSDALQVGNTIRIEVFEKFFPFNITGGTVRIRSVSTGYDSGDRPLTFERDGRSLYYHWDTGGLTPASDYKATVTLLDKSGNEAFHDKSYTGTLQASDQSDATVSLTNKEFVPPFLATVVDAFAPAPGIPLEFRRVVPYDPANYPYGGPLGRGWVHNYDVSLEEYTDGRIAFHGQNGFNRFFTSNDDGTYTSSPGDYVALTRDSDGTFTLIEKDKLVYRFRTDLRLDFIEDLNGNKISAIYDSSNRLIEIRHSSGQSFSLNYNNIGLISSLTDHAGRVTTYEYSSMSASNSKILTGFLAITFVLSKVTDPAGNVTKYTYSWGQSAIVNYRLLSIAYPDGTYAHYEYDNQARLIKQSGTWGANPLTYSYDSDGTTLITNSVGGKTVTKVNDRGQPISIIKPDGGKIQNEYDASANLTQVTDPLSHATQFSYDSVGNVTQVKNPLNQAFEFGYDLRFNKRAKITNPHGNTTSFAYDAKGNLTTITYPDSNKEIFAYDAHGNATFFQDAEGETTTYSYNDYGQITSLQNALGNITQFSYDTVGNLQSVTDAKGHAVSHTRDTLGRLTRRTYSDSSHENYEYNGTGKVTAFTNRRGESISFTYDVTGRLEWKTYSSGKKLHFLYDGAGNLANIEQVVGSTITLDTAYERDALHRITKAKVPGKAYTESYLVSYAYNAADNRTFMAYPDGYGLNYAYDAANRLKRIADASDNTIVAYEYDAVGRMTKRTLGNETYTVYTYDNLDHLTSLINYSPTGIIQSQFSYTYNTAGIRTSMTTLEGTHNYSYDDIYQLTSISFH